MKYYKLKLIMEINLAGPEARGEILLPDSIALRVYQLIDLAL